MKLSNFKKNEYQTDSKRSVPHKSVNFVNYFDKSKKVSRPKPQVKLKGLGKSFFKLYNLVLFPLLGLALASLVYFVLFKTNIFTIVDVYIHGTENYVSTLDFNELVQNKVYGKNLLFLNDGELRHVLLDTFLGAKEINVTKKLPNSLEITVTERKPMALIYKDSEQATYIIDFDGYVLGLADEKTTDLPKIQYEGDVKVGSFMDKNLVPLYFELVSALDNSHMKASTMSFHPGFVQLYVGNSTQIMLSNSKNIKDSVGVFSTLYNQLLVEGKKVTKIDLRYDKVIVSYE